MNRERRKSLALAASLLSVALLSACGGGDGGDAGAPARGTDAAPAPSASRPAEGTPAPTGTATVSGTIRFEGEVPNLRPLKMDADPGCAKQHSGPVAAEALVLGDDNTVANIFVQVKSGLPQGSYPTPSEPVTLDQRGCQYKPHVIGVRVGQPFKILNSDSLLHNVHSLPEINASFNRAMPATVTEATYTFDKPEPMFKIKCDVHPWMSAWVGVTTHPYFDVTGTDGRFAIAGLPAGTYEIEAWHERMGTRTATVTVADGQSVTADMTYAM